MRLFKFALPCLFVAGLSLFFARAWADRADQASHALQLEHARRQFVERAAVVRASPDTEHYRGELRALLRDWFAGQMELGNRYPALRGQPGAFVPPAPRAHGADLREWQELADGQIGAWREGRVDLVESAASAGLRLDLLRVKKGAQRLAVDVAVWGAPQESETEEAAPGQKISRVTVPLVFRGLAMRFFDAGGKMMARMEASGEPALRLDVPERLAVDAPPGVVLARYEPGLLPPGVAEVEWTLTAQIRAASGEPRTAQAVWRVKADPAWAGAEWTGDDKVVAESPAETPTRAPAVARGAASAGGHDASTAVWPARE